MIVANLLNVAGHEYAEAITNDTVIAVVEFRDGRAFTQQAERLLHILESNSRNYATIVKDLKIPIANINQKMVEIGRQEELKQTIDKIIRQIYSIMGL
jgi:hypothetical protein